MVVLELLNYIVYEPTSEKDYPNGVRDKGRNGMLLADFLQHENTQRFGLTREEVHKRFPIAQSRARRFPIHEQSSSR